ncbi:MAG: DUF2207 domain-containing protein [Elusimicrobia bacterium]|nr:DUF2207 domain-containing protein [Elusimicrobiota bacterium]
MMKAAAVVLALLWAAPARAQDERILKFESRISVRPDGSMFVQETIKVRAAGRAIKRGIYRDFPTSYKDRLGHHYNVEFRVADVKKNEAPEPYRVEHRGNGERVYIGSKDVLLQPGEYMYTLGYETSRQLGFFKDHDELYWNATGNGWMFTIDEAVAIVEVPVPGEKLLEKNAYTGVQGSKNQAYALDADEAGHPVFKTTRPLGPAEGMTIVVAWPKGFVTPPPLADKARYFFKDNRGALAGAATVLLVFGYYVLVWSKFGKDPEAGSIMAIYEPPKGVSPGSSRFISQMGYDEKIFGATLINMAVKGFLKMEESSREYTLTKVGDYGVLNDEEKAIASSLFAGRDSIVLKQSNHAPIAMAVSGLEQILKSRNETLYFITNIHYFAGGLVMSIAGLLLTALATEAQETPAALMVCVVLTGWTLGVAALGRTVMLQWSHASATGAAGDYAKLLFLSLFFVPFTLGEAAVVFFVMGPVGISLPLFAVALAAMNYLFYHLLKAPTLAGRALMDKIEGFKMFLAATEKDRLNVLYPVDRTPAMFEKYLPYALALDVEHQWAERFADVLAKAGQDGQPYQPAWYSGRRWDSYGSPSFCSHIGDSVSSAISSSSTAPGESSGSSFGGGGGGSSGGGGGGGGGGGW